MVPARQLNLRAYLCDRFLHSAAKVAAAHTVLDRNIPLVSFTVDFRATVLLFNFAESTRCSVNTGKYAVTIMAIA